MKISTTTLSFLILAAALGSHAQVIEESTMEGHQVQVSIIKGFHSPADCCLSYTSQKIRCELMTSYFETSSGCSRPGVIFLTKKGKFVCADPFNKRVRNCMTYLKPSDTKDLKKMNLA
ncbi:C-C motif chemokine 14 isoform X3 [Equus asinus]|uniref:C-C motif chemokine n=1 Tax=Equus przewalskii TaxID=9798 RepID=A0ABM2EX08_EQUPR|nr:C-C motif chemokine 15 isoform X2 [Equus caballus]XP_008523816.1 PREDICTED: C-C motif chemokine 15-like isoform X2 [Equus przewalskii]XP_014717731.1 C-C motif chemokine 15 isoform X2 [Equus asinus]XP_046533620.1 C-C motif chemokine 14 isoform X3 [Equus quagga]